MIHKHVLFLYFPVLQVASQGELC